MTAHGPGLRNYPFIGEPPQQPSPRKRWTMTDGVWAISPTPPAEAEGQQ